MILLLLNILTLHLFIFLLSFNNLFWFIVFSLLLHLGRFLVNGFWKRKLGNQTWLLFIIFKLQPNRCFFNFLIDKQVGTLTLPSPVFTTETINFNIMRIKLSNSFIIKLYPSIFALLDIAEIMTKLSTSIMQHNTL